MKLLVTLKCSLPVKNTQNFGVLASQNCNFYKNLSPLVRFHILFEKHDLWALSAKVFKKIYLNRPPTPQH